MKTSHALASAVGRGLCLLAVCGAGVPPAQAADPTVWRTVSDQRLDTLRGGFDAGAGLRVGFGISRAVYINGALMTQTTLNLDQLSQLTPAQALQLNHQIAGMNLVQNGPGNSVQGGVSGLGAGLVIQNTLNNQQIQVQTLIHASTNGLGMLRNINTLGTLRDAVTGALGSR